MWVVSAPAVRTTKVREVRYSSRVLAVSRLRGSAPDRAGAPTDRRGAAAAGDQPAVAPEVGSPLAVSCARRAEVRERDQAGVVDCSASASPAGSNRARSAMSDSTTPSRAGGQEAPDVDVKQAEEHAGQDRGRSARQPRRREPRRIGPRNSASSQIAGVTRHQQQRRAPSRGRRRSATIMRRRFSTSSRGGGAIHCASRPSTTHADRPHQHRAHAARARAGARGAAPSGSRWPVPRA